MLINDTYIVTSIKNSKEEIEKLKLYHLPILFYDNPDVYYDEVGGFHDGPDGWSPYGIHCGECSRSSCKGCETYESK